MVIVYVKLSPKWSNVILEPLISRGVFQCVPFMTVMLPGFGFLVTDDLSGQPPK